jgi:hypothetical protein
MRFPRAQARIFFAGYFLSVIAFLIIFAVGMALVYEHRLISSRITVDFLINFVYSMGLYFVLTAAFSFLTYRLLLTARTEIRIFILTYGISLITLYVTSMLVRIYWGHSLIFILFQGDAYSLLLYMSLLGVLSSAPAVFSVLVYEIYRLASKLLVKKGQSIFKEK